MKNRLEERRNGSPTEDGYMLIAVIFLLAILMIVLAVAMPRVRQDLQRDREMEAMHRGKQYIRAVQLYYRKFHAYPPNLDALVQTNNVRFLRKKYLDPITGKDDWAPILFGQNKVPMTMGFFGKEMPGTPVAGTGPGAGIGSPLSGSSSSGSSSLAPANPVGSSGSQDSGPAGGQAFGGAGIIGFSIPSEKQSLLIYKKQDRFDRWEFVYSPMQEMGVGLGGAGAGAGGIGGGPGSANGNSPGSGNPGDNGTNNPWGPNGNLPSPTPTSPGTPTGNPWGPNGNLPSPQ